MGKSIHGRPLRGRVAAAAVASACLLAVAVAGVGTASGKAVMRGGTVKILVESAVNTPVGSFPGVWGGAQAAAAAINKAGGINGQRIQVILCNDEFSTNGAAACAHTAVADHVIAYTGFSPFGFVVAPILASAKITMSPWIGNLSDAANPSILPVNGGGSMPEGLAPPYAAKLAGAKTVAFVETQFPGLATLIALQAKEARKLGMKVLGTIQVSETDTDLSTALQQLASLKPDAVLINTDNSQTVTLMQDAQGIAFNPIWSGALSPFEVTSLKAAAKLTSKLWVSTANPVETSNSTIGAAKQFGIEMNAATKAGLSNAAAINRDAATMFTWATIHALAEVGDTLHSSITAKTFAKTIKRAKNVNVEGLWNWTPGAKGPSSLLPHVTDGGQVYVGVVQSNGTVKYKTRVPILKVGGLQ